MNLPNQTVKQVFAIKNKGTEMIQSLSLINNIEQIPLLTSWVTTVGKDLQLSDTSIFQLNLALEEAVVNVMNYAYPDVQGMPILLTVETQATEGSVLFTLIDEGIPFDPTTKIMPDITLPAMERPIGGLGIFLIEQLMENVTYKRVGDKNVLEMKYKIKA